MCATYVHNIPGDKTFYDLALDFCVVYNRRGYVELVSEAAEDSMKAAIEEVQALPHYTSNGEVVLIFQSKHSGSSLTQGTIQLRMPTILQSPASLEGRFIKCTY